MGRKCQRCETSQQTEYLIEDHKVKRETTPIEAKTEAQGHYIVAIEQNRLVFGVGSAGTGKTYISMSLALAALDSKQTKKIIITRPAVEAGENLGFLPGELQQKFDPYLAPLKDVMYRRLGQSKAEYMVKRNVIEAVPLAYMRGMTFHDCWVILDEAQNVSAAQMKMFLTRIGHNCRVIVNGDPSQVDIPGVNGLTDAVERLHELRGVQVVEFSDEDVVRSGLVGRIVQAYSKAA